MPDNDVHRVDILTGKVGMLTGEVGALTGEVKHVRAGVDELRSALAILVRYEERMGAHAADAAGMQTKIEALNARLATIEVEMPQLKEARALAVRALSGLVAVVGLAVLALVVKR